MLKKNKLGFLTWSYRDFLKGFRSLGKHGGYRDSVEMRRDLASSTCPPTVACGWLGEAGE